MRIGKIISVSNLRIDILLDSREINIRISLDGTK